MTIPNPNGSCSGGDQARFLKRQLLLPVSMMSPMRGCGDPAPHKGMCEPVEECGGHLGITEDTGPFAKGEVGGDDHGGSLVETVDQVEEQLLAGLGEGQIAEFVEDQEIQAAKQISGATLPVGAGFGIEFVEQIDDVEEPSSSAVTNTGAGDGNSEMGLAGAGAGGGDEAVVTELLEARLGPEPACPHYRAEGSRPWGRSHGLRRFGVRPAAGRSTR